MKVNLHVAFKNAMGGEACQTVNGERKLQMIDDTLCISLFNGDFLKHTGNQETDAVQKLQAFELYQKIRNNKGEADFTTEECTMLKKAASMLPPGAYGQIYNLIEGKE